MLIYHGSTLKIEKPNYEKGKPTNDFGKGFYCTDDLEKAKEWACKERKNGYVNSYEINIKDLKVLDLTSDKYNVLNWISILLKNRTFNIHNQIAYDAKAYLQKYYIDTTKYDIVIGYRADDSYFSYAQNFLENSLSLNNLEKAMKLGNLGIQIVLVSKKAFKKIKYIESIEVNKDIYYSKFINNDIEARENYRKMKSNKNDEFIIDIMRKDNVRNESI